MTTVTTAAHTTVSRPRSSVMGKAHPAQQRHSHHISLSKPQFLDLRLATDYFPLSTLAPSLSASSSTSASSLSSLSFATDSTSALLHPLHPREESTRVQLHRQRLRDQNSADFVSKSIPGFKTSAAFFASLRTNLRLNASPPASPISTPGSMRASLTSLPPPSPLVSPADMSDQPIPTSTSEDPLAGVPELTTEKATDRDARIDGLQLVADSVAQMRQTANSTLIFHPLNLAIVAGILAVYAQILRGQGFDWSMVALSGVGVLMAALAACRYVTQGYIRAAESLNMEWLGDADVWVTRFGGEPIGAVIVDWVSGESSKSSNKKRKAWQGRIRGWAVVLRYRGKGVGTALMEEAIAEARKKGAEVLEFDDDHANSVRVLPDFYNRIFEKREDKLRARLATLWNGGAGSKKK